MPTTDNDLRFTLADVSSPKDLAETFRRLYDDIKSSYSLKGTSTPKLYELSSSSSHQLDGTLPFVWLNLKTSASLTFMLVESTDRPVPTYSTVHLNVFLGSGTLTVNLDILSNSWASANGYNLLLTYVKLPSGWTLLTQIQV